MLFNFANVLVFLVIGLGFVFVSLLMSSLVRPRVPTKAKLASYECGEIPTEPAWINFNIRFYILAILFIIFDVEIAFMFPVGVVFRQWVADGNGVMALLEIAVFVLVLLLGLVYVWRQGDLEWARKSVLPDRNMGTEIMKKASSIP